MKGNLQVVALIWCYNIEGCLQQHSRPPILTWEDMKLILVDKILHDDYTFFTWLGFEFKMVPDV